MKWIQALRLRTLPLALSSIGMGAFLAARVGQYNHIIFLFCCLTTVLLQILSNLANDYGDAIHGADHAGRSGPKRMVQSGLISHAQMKIAIIIVAVLSFISGAYLLWIVFGPQWEALFVFLIIGVMCILAALTYTLGKRPYGYAGLGDFSVFMFFGITGVVGTFYLMAQLYDWLNLMPAAACGLFSVAVLNINNTRDIESDRIAGKNSLPVRWGKSWAIKYHWVLLMGGILSAAIYTMLTFQTGYQLLFLLVIPLFVRNAMVMSEPSSNLDPWLKQLALSTLLFVVLFGLGLIM